MIAYRERNLAESVKDCLEKAEHPENLFFSIVSEQSLDSQHADLSFVSPEKIIYRKYDLSEYRSIMWSRHKTTEVDFDYDYILYTCGHNLFAQGWDTLVLNAISSANKYSEKAIITSSGPEYEYTENGDITYEPRSGRTMNKYRPQIPSDFVPGYGFPNSLQAEVPTDVDIIEDVYMQWSWVFAPKQYVLEVPIDVEMGYHGEEIYLTVLSWCRGWRFFATPSVLYFHDTYKEYPGEDESRMISHRPWADVNQKAFWEHSDESMRRLNKLLSGSLYSDVTLNKVLEYCDYSGLNKEYCRPYDDYSKLGLERHAEPLKYRDPYLGN